MHPVKSGEDHGVRHAVEAKERSKPASHRARTSFSPQPLLSEPPNSSESSTWEKEQPSIGHDNV
jgi:hypothetical protein